MRKVVLGMMATLNGRVDDPDAWMTGIGDDLYRDIDAWFERCVDTVLVGRTTYDEMYAYWPGAEHEPSPRIGEQIPLQESAWQINRRMARKMNAYQKFVFTRTGRAEALGWSNAELIVAESDQDLVSFIAELKMRPGRDIHLAGGARLAQSFVRLGLVDEYHLHVHPVISTGATPFDTLEVKCALQLLGTSAYEAGVVSLRYGPAAG
jgi:dihydrofolate reductase